MTTTEQLKQLIAAYNNSSDTTYKDEIYLMIMGLNYRLQQELFESAAK